MSQMSRSCSICRDSLDEVDQCCLIECGHVFHFDCVKKWLRIKEECPTCRTKSSESHVCRLYFSSEDNSNENSLEETVQKYAQIIGHQREQIIMLQENLDFYDAKSRYFAAACKLKDREGKAMKQKVEHMAKEIDDSEKTILAMGSEIDGLRKQIMDMSSMQDTLNKRLPVIERKREYFTEAPFKSNLSATWIGHATVLLQIDGVTIIIDPVWAKRVSSWLVSPLIDYDRYRPVPVEIDQLPKIDIGVISHNDHFEPDTIERITVNSPDIQWFVPKGLKLPKFAKDKRKSKEEKIKINVTELTWGEAYKFNVETHTGEIIRIPSKNDARPVPKNTIVIMCIPARGRSLSSAQMLRSEHSLSEKCLAFHNCTTRHYFLYHISLLILC
ncbi:ring finger domain-containing protein [Ditylenchus destructor]|uniref:Ring finger domain-containing protein n=1 Tax=Ditylenchus destructor TaxID=166010 RepID=A0AAD4MMR7_9BILA|nr:ring finger domain-containing protein [Ditylenchus destructor]